MATRTEVYAAIDGERIYQDNLWGPSGTEGKHSVEEFLLYMEDYMNEARHILSREALATAKPKALNVMRKVVAMGVSCMEQHGAPCRLLPYELLTKAYNLCQGVWTGTDGPIHCELAADHTRYSPTSSHKGHRPDGRELLWGKDYIA